MTESQDRAPLIREAIRIQENCLYTSTAHFISSAIMWRLHMALGTLPIVFGAIGGWNALTDPGVVGSAKTAAFASFCSFFAGALGSVLSFWNLAENRARHLNAATQFKSLEHDARRAHEIHSSEPYEDLKRRVVELGDRYNKLNEVHIQTAEWAFKRAQKKIGAGHFKSEVEQLDPAKK